MSLHIPAGYVNLLGNLENTEKAIKAVKDMGASAEIQSSVWPEEMRDKCRMAGIDLV